MKKMIEKGLVLAVVVALFAALGVLTSCSSKSQIEIAALAANAECPIDAGNGLVISQVETSGKSVVYTCKVSEYQLGVTVDEINDPLIKSMMRAAMIEAIQNGDEDTRELARLCKEAEYDIVFLFIGDSSGEECKIRIPWSEL